MYAFILLSHPHKQKKQIEHPPSQTHIASWTMILALVRAFGLAAAAVVAILAGGAAAVRLSCPPARKPTTLNFAQRIEGRFPVTLYKSLLYDNVYFVPMGYSSCGYGVGGPNLIMNNNGKPASVTAQMTKCQWMPISITASAAYVRIRRD